MDDKPRTDWRSAFWMPTLLLLAVVSRAASAATDPLPPSLFTSPLCDPERATDSVEEGEKGGEDQRASFASLLLAVSPEAEAMREGRLLLGEGDRLQEAGELTAARETWQQAAETFERAGAPLEASDALQRIGSSYIQPSEIASLAQGDLRPFLTSFLRSIQISAKVLEEGRRKDFPLTPEQEGRADRAEELFERASEQALQESCDEALPLLAEAGEMFREVGSKVGEAKVQMFEVRCRFDPENPASTLEILPVVFNALDLLTGMPLGDSTTLLDLEAGDLLAQGRLDLAETKYLELLDRYEEEGDLSGVAGALMDLGALNAQRGEYEAALERSCAALDASRSVDDEYRLQNLGAIHHNLGGIARDLGRPTVAAEEMTMALTIWRALGRPDREAGTLAILGKTQADLGRLREGRATLEEARSLQDKLSPDPAAQAVILGNLAAVAYQQGSYREALELQQEATNLVPIDSPGLPAHLLQGILGTALGDPDGAPTSSGNTSSQELGRLGPLIPLQESLQLLLSGKESQGLQALQGALEGVVEMGLGGDSFLRLLESFEAFLQTDPLDPQHPVGILSLPTQSVGNSILDEYLLLAQAMTTARQGNLEDARSLAQRQLEKFEGQGNHLGQLLGHIALTSIHLCPPGQDIARALPHMEAAAALLDEVSTSLPSQIQAFFQGGLLARGVFDATVFTAFVTDRPEEAFKLSERSRARAFHSQLGRLNEDLARRLLAEPGSKNGNDEIRELRLRMDYLRERLGSPALQGFEHAREREVLQQELDDLEQGFGRERRWEAVTTEATTALEALTLDEIQARLPEGVTLVEYYVSSLTDLLESPPESESSNASVPVLAWILDSQEIASLSLEVDTETLRHEIQAFRALLATRDEGWREASQSLYRHLIAPLRPHLDPHTELWLVPHRSLHHLPFAALLDPETGRLLIEDFQITHLPSASSLGLLPQGTSDASGRGVLAVGDPDGSLPAAAQETSAIARLFPEAEVLTGAAAREGEVRRSIENHRVLHFATHGQYDPEHPLFSHLQLLPDEHHDGRLEAHEILDLDLRGTDLVVLSGCETGTAEPTGGDEVPSLSRAFLAAGAHNVLASLWRVEDQATADLMEGFYHYWKTGKGSAEALRRAQLDTRQRYPHPYDWAGFELSGRGD